MEGEGEMGKKGRNVGLEGGRRGSGRRDVSGNNKGTRAFLAPCLCGLCHFGLFASKSIFCGFFHLGEL